MAGDDTSIRSKARRRHDTANKSRRHRPSKAHKSSEGIPIQPTPSNPLPDLETLRKARLAFFSQTPEERRKKMKYEHVPQTDARSSEKDLKRSTRRKNRHSTDSKGLSEVGAASESSKRRRRHRSRSKIIEESSDEDEYVYGKPVTAVRSQSSRTAIASAQPRSRPAQDSQRTKFSTGTLVEERETPVRRHTEPGGRKFSFSVIPHVNDASNAPLRNVERRNTSESGSQRPPLKRSATSTRTKTEISVTKSSAFPAPQPKKAPSIISTFLGAKSPASEKKVPCLTCGSDDVPYSKSAKLPCSHRMCHSCLKRIFKMSITDPAHMPPRCCTNDHIDLKHVDKLFDQNFKKTWNRKFDEYKTKNRIYCPTRGCGEWIKPNHITVEHGRKIGKCKKCGMKVCGICNQKAHGSKECPKDPATKEFVEVAKEKGWKQCYHCSAMVELKEGCNHMTCRCTAEFCMVCGLKWKTCDCPWFNYEQVDAHLGNPVRYQEELDRRRDQEQRDEALARRMEVLGVRGRDDPIADIWGFGNAARHHMNQNFVQHARDALTANYQQAEQAARGLLNGFVMGRENHVPIIELPVAQPPQPRPRRRATQQHTIAPAGNDNNLETPAVDDSGRPNRRNTTRRRNLVEDMFTGRSQTAEEQAQETRIQNWANGVI